MSKHVAEKRAPERAHVILPLVKVDVAKRLVYGEMTSEEVDKASEIMDYDSSRPYFEKWSEKIAKATDGKSLGNVRAMHQPIAAGKLTSIEFDDEAKKILICAKIVDEAEWQKVLEGVYTGFSIGGSYVKRWDDPDRPGVKRFTVNPAEVSVVDNPCNDTCYFTAVKADGTTEQMLFKVRETTGMYEPTNDEVAARATEMAKAAGNEKLWVDHCDAAREALKAEHAAKDAPPAETQEASEAAAEPEAEAPAADDAGDADGTDKAAPAELTAEQRAEISERALKQVWQASDGTTFEKKADAVAHEAKKAAPPAPEDPVEAALAKARRAGEDPAAEPEAPAVPAWKSEARHTVEVYLAVRKHYDGLRDGLVAKGLYAVSRLADYVESLEWITSSAFYEAEAEGDGSGVPAQLMDGLKTLCAALVAMCQEEVAEMLAAMQKNGAALEVLDGGDVVVVELSEKPGEAIKVSQDVADAVAKLAPAAAPGEDVPENREDPAAKLFGEDGSLTATDEELAKMAETSPLVKAFVEQRVKITTLEEQVGKAVSGIEELGKTIEKLRKEPAPMAPRTSVVGKDGATSEGGGTDSAAMAIIEELGKTEDGRQMLALAAIRKSQARTNSGG